MLLSSIGHLAMQDYTLHFSAHSNFEKTQALIESSHNSNGGYKDTRFPHNSGHVRDNTGLHNNLHNIRLIRTSYK